VALDVPLPKLFEYDIELLERWDDDSSYERITSSPYPYGESCGLDLDIWEGDRVRILVEDHEFHVASGCKSAVFRPSNPEEHGWEILSSMSQAGSSTIFVGQFDARIGECEGLLQIEVREIDPADNLYSATQRGELPNFALNRQFKSTDCPAIGDSCGDWFVVQIHPVE
jgi:hypothetical protein